MKKLWLLLLVGTTALSGLRAQSELDQSAFDQTIFNQYVVSPILINPGATGFENVHQLQMNLRRSYTGFTGTPQTYALNYNGPVGETFGLGAGLLTENVGAMSRLRFSMSAAFRYSLSEDLQMGTGLSAEFRRTQLDMDVMNNVFTDPDDQQLQSLVDGESVFDAAFGAFGRYREYTTFGISFPNLVLARLGDIAGDDPAGAFFRYYIFNAGHEFVIDGYNFSIEPSVMVRKLKNTPFQMDFNVLSRFLDEQLMAGLSYRTGTGSGIGILLGTAFKDFQVVYSYDISTSQTFQEYNSGSHELMVGFEFGGQKNRFDRAARY